MKAIGFRTPLPIDHPDSLIDLDMPLPELRPQDLLVEIQAVSVNPVDVKVRAGTQPPPGAARVLGYDAVGTVTAIGSLVTLFKPGDEVYYAGVIDRPGSNAQFQAVDERIVARKPATLTAAQAAALPLTTITAWELLFDQLRVPYGQKRGGDALLIIGGAGGVGSMLIQLARRLTGLTVIATASRPDSADWCRTLGAHHIIDHRQKLEDGLAAIGIPEVRYVAALTATAQHLPSIVTVLAPQGAMAVIDDPGTLDIMPFKRKSLSVHWELMFTRPLFTTPDMIRQHELLTEAADLVDAGVLRSTLTQELGPIDVATLRQAHKLVESGRSIGKVVMRGW